MSWWLLVMVLPVAAAWHDTDTRWPRTAAATRTELPR